MFMEGPQDGEEYEYDEKKYFLVEKIRNLFSNAAQKDLLLANRYQLVSDNDMKRAGVRQFNLLAIKGVGKSIKTLSTYMTRQKQLLAQSGDVKFSQSAIMQTDVNMYIPKHFINKDSDVERVAKLEAEAKLQEEINRKMRQEEQMRKQEEQQRQERLRQEQEAEQVA